MEEDHATYTLSILAETCGACRDAIGLLPENDIVFDVRVVLSKAEGLLLTMIEDHEIDESLLNDLSYDALILSEQVRRIQK